MHKKRYSLTLILCFCGIELIYEKSSAMNIIAHYRINPEKGLFGLACLAQHVEYNRAVRVHNSSNICELLDSSWNSNPVFEDGFIYMQMLSFERRFPEAYKTTSDIPKDFHVGYRIDTVLQTFGVPLRRFQVIVNDYNTNTTFIHVQFRPFENVTAFRSELNGTRTDDILAPLPTFTANTIYLVSVYLQVSHWEVFLDGIPLNTYTHVYPFQSTGKQKARFWGQDVTCRSIIFPIP